MFVYNNALQCLIYDDIKKLLSVVCIAIHNVDLLDTGDPWLGYMLSKTVFKCL